MLPAITHSAAAYPARQRSPSAAVQPGFCHRFAEADEGECSGGELWDSELEIVLIPTIEGCDDLVGVGSLAP
jgi:hypothetical protein